MGLNLPCGNCNETFYLGQGCWRGVKCDLSDYVGEKKSLERKLVKNSGDTEIQGQLDFVNNSMTSILKRGANCKDKSPDDVTT